VNDGCATPAAQVPNSARYLPRVASSECDFLRAVLGNGTEHTAHATIRPATDGGSVGRSVGKNTREISITYVPGCARPGFQMTPGDLPEVIPVTRVQFLTIQARAVQFVGRR